ncbi:hypothetical protein M5K25_016744 [Dendrobium thyrsiflorum]|uniref:BRO1 domain-containing protein n=1 Tax=Dendrobium thyrsiflorum TaxID=117978 RepID=A0ABD0USF9_DENTH
MVVTLFRYLKTFKRPRDIAGIEEIAAAAAAYYYHGLILDEGNTEKFHGMAVAALQAAEEFLKESKSACEVFNVASPTSRSPPPWGSMKFLSDKIPKDVSSKAHTTEDLYSQERILQAAPVLPDFALALNPDDYQLPPLDPIWNTVMSTKEDLKYKISRSHRLEIPILAFGDVL